MTHTLIKFWLILTKNFLEWTHFGPFGRNPFKKLSKFAPFTALRFAAQISPLLNYIYFNLRFLENWKLTSQRLIASEKYCLFNSPGILGWSYLITTVILRRFPEGWTDYISQWQSLSEKLMLQCEQFLGPTKLTKVCPSPSLQV